ncbi:hypothetical protein ABB37_08527 [Leptomonas pyrrhocoris]|uniref:Uncharacterized protein n=1 Tax=Leptomonas pyrrhocoris TaxID=157538 RepID=A0A0N0DS02_LEPPY|nr:hypothetical protein ABB37_08527 [Leptomonas pyrrhocoris]KPA75211.1 hypothetical protein ABB37_08527 [Leptomonas pyrrhocoris]|eukprot:XP_015653650.1 hypothetical protein ABB37_08527 [Leptomonas pyrrhocoris]
MLQSTNVTLRRTSDAPLRRIRDAYGSADNAETLLEQCVLAGEGRVKSRDASLTDSEDTQHMWGALVVLLSDLSDYGALGKMGGVDERFCRRLQPLLARLLKCVLKGGFEVARRDRAKESSYDLEELLEATSKALANCCEGVTRRCADTTLEVQLDAKSDTSIHGHELGNSRRSSSLIGTAPNDAAVLRVCFGFADYTSGETGAMLWAGAVGLSLYLIENYQAIIVKKACEARASTEAPLRVIELGCGPALVSLVLAAMAAWDTPTTVPCCLDVTDVSASVVEEARRSFQHRNGPALSSMLDLHSGHGGSANDEQRTATSPASFQVRPFILDFGDIPPELCGVYDVVVASDVVYDYAIAAHVAGALEALLKPGGVALLCCEAHRDGMAHFTQRIRLGHPNALHLRVTQELLDVRTVLSQLEMPSGLTSSTCSLMRIEKVAA